MFTGIIEATGIVESVQKNRISVRTPWNPAEIRMGQSISIHGCCLTVVDIQGQTLSFDLSDETLSKTHFRNLQKNQRVNLERGMGVDSRFDGHWVSGHVDTIAHVKKITVHADSRIFAFDGLEAYHMHLVPKGSIAVDGVSLTINEVFEGGFNVSVIPYTFEHTCFSMLKEKDSVNIEFDVIGKYLLKYMENHQKFFGRTNAGNN